MNKNIKTRFLNRRFWKFGLVFLAVFFVFYAENKASAVVSCSDSKAKFKCTVVAVTGGSSENCAETEADCQAWCDKINTSVACNIQAYNSATKEVSGERKTSEVRANDESVFLLPFKWLIYGVFKFCTWLLALAGIIFDWVINPDNVNFIMNNAGLYASWAMVRDFLNLGFILVLLYIAFCVIFQIGSYADGWKKMLLMMVIMALLVNFSFPICRFIIDVSNIAFYYILNTGFPGPQNTGSAIVTDLTNTTKLGSILDVGNISITSLIAMTVFTFISALTFMVIAILFVVRMTAIGLLIIFSPIGFAGAAFPFSKKYASDWWDNLFKYAFFAPIMIFMIVVARNIMKFTSTAGILESARKNIGVGEDPNIFGNMAFFAIPIVILWFGMQMAQKMSIAGASEVTGMANKAAKWVGRNFTGQAGLGGAAAHWANRKLAESEYGKYVSPMAIKDAWKERNRIQDQKALDKAKGGVMNAMNRAVDYASWANPFIGVKRLAKGFGAAGSAEAGKKWAAFKNGATADFERTDYDFIYKTKGAHRREKEEIEDVSESSEYVIDRLKHGLQAGDSELVVASVNNLIKHNNLNDLLRTNDDTLRSIFKQLVKMDEDGNPVGFEDGSVSQERATAAISKLYELSGAKGEQLGKLMMNAGEMTTDKANFLLSGSGNFDNETGKFVAYEGATLADKQKGMIQAKWSNFEPQDRQKKSHIDAFYETDENGRVVGMSLGGRSLFTENGKGIDGGDIDQLNRGRQDTRNGHSDYFQMIQRARKGEYTDVYGKALSQERIKRLKKEIAMLDKKAEDGGNETALKYLEAVHEFKVTGKKGGGKEDKKPAVSISNSSSGSSGQGGAGTEEMGGDDD